VSVVPGVVLCLDGIGNIVNGSMEMADSSSILSAFLFESSVW
jgi:hypothetical protein